ncbi:siderophore ABC transporter substrate-binding protein [Limoniibacter endophyticus]|uniref:Iron ABC transporter substrate-binding protein n=1 Tax=Limoniibacter endophyticus TaxID=1565040 RepID=A0A8J3DG85_9HYPH|nr:siderophore ABC transporter substrate-binding protein [Limoniibacter endophyticus]GHC64072.1 iron ABC transporter substrate-binding protein [Limoniibacter endophyticus]
MIINRHSLALAGALALALGASVPTFAQELVVTHTKGETKLTAKPAKVLTFDLATLDTLDALGVEVAGVPGGAKPDYLAKYEDKKYEKIGTFFEPDYEAVNAAEPDLIVVAGRSSAKYDDLAKIAPTIDLTVDAKNYLASSVANVQKLGEIFGKQAEAKELVEKLEKTTADLKASAANAGTALVILTTGGKMSAYGEGSRFGVAYSDYGFKPAAKTDEKANHGQAISNEFILETNPDWLLVIDRDAAIGREGQSAQQMLDNEIVHKTKAWQEGNVVYLKSANWYTVNGGVQALQQNVDQLSEAVAKKQAAN